MATNQNLITEESIKSNVNIPKDPGLTFYYQQRPQEYSQLKQNIQQKEALKKQQEVENISSQLDFTNVTNAQSYEEQYERIPQGYKQYFTSPETVKQNFVEFRTGEATKIQTEIAKAQTRYEKEKADYQKDLEWSRNKKWSSSEKRRDYERKIEDDFEEEEAYYKGYLSKLNEGLNKINSGQNFTYKAVQNYADEYGDYRETREEYKNRQRKDKVKFEAELKAVDEASSYKEYARAYAKLPDTLKGGFTPPASTKVRNYFDNLPKMSVTITETPAQTLPGIRARDYVGAPGKTFSGANVWDIPGSELDKSAFAGGGTSALNKQNKLFNFGYERPQIQETGVLFVTETEGKKLAEKGFSSYWVVQSKDLQSAITEGQFASGVNQRSGFYNTRGQFEFNRQQIIAQQNIYKQYQGIITDFESNPGKYKGRAGVTVTEVKGGEQINLTSEYFQKNINAEQVYKNALVSAKSEYSSLPFKTRARLYATGVGTGASQFVIGAGEFAGTLFFNFGTQTFTEEELKNRPKGLFGLPKSRQFSFGGYLGNVRTYPTTQSTVGFLENPKSYAKQKATSPEFVGGAVIAIPAIAYGAKSVISNFKTYGVAGGLAETASSFSPIRIQGGIYTPRVDSSTKLKVTSIKYTNKEGVTTRYYSGKNSFGDVKVSGVEKSALVNGKIVGGGIKTTTTPYIEIRGGGGIVNTGVRETVQPYSFSSRGIGEVYGARGGTLFTQQLTAKIPGGLTDVKVSKGIDIFTQSGGKETTVFNYLDKGFKFTTGGSSKEIQTGVSRFFSGRAKPIYKVEKFGDIRYNLDSGTKSQDFIYKPSGRFKIKPNIFGTEYDLNKILSNSYYSAGSGATTTGGSGGGTRTATKAIQSSKNIIGVDIPIQSSQVANLPQSNIIVSQPVQKAKSKQSKSYNAYSAQVIKEVQNQQPKGATRVVNAVSTLQRSAQRTQQKAIVAPVVTPKPVEAIKQNTAQASVVVQRVKLVQLQKSGSGSGFYDFVAPDLYRPYAPEKTTIPVIPIKLGGFNDVNLGIGNVPSKPTGRAYTPSYTALAFNIRGKQTKPNKTGLDFRPVTKGFNVGQFLGFGGRTRRVKVIRIRRLI